MLKNLGILLIIIFAINKNIIADNSGRLKDKVVIVTGAGKGIGVGIAKVFAKEGAKLIISSLTKTDLEKLTTEINMDGGIASFVVGDITKQDDMNRIVNTAIEKYGRVDVFIHNAASLFPFTKIDEITNEQWLKSINCNLNSAFYIVKAVLPQMKKQNYGRILFTSSISGPRVGLPGKSPYTTAKAGMNGFMRTIAIELAKYNITVNAVEPGNVMTEGLKVNDPKQIEARIKAVPMKRLGTIEEIAYAHLFLASDEASYITGQSIIIDGGQTLPETHFNLLEEK